ncbi:MAG: DUF6494 family protein [Pseudomonadota bacterium]
MSDAYNMSMRKFLKQLGVTSQQAIEEALRTAEADGKTFAVTATVSIPELSMTHTIEGTIGEEKA